MEDIDLIEKLRLIRSTEVDACRCFRSLRLMLAACEWVGGVGGEALRRTAHAIKRTVDTTA